jgi:phosphoribosylglycinamide formyltransferase-1
MGAPEARARRTRTAVLISGRGSNLAALIHACASPDAAGEIALVISNRPDAAGLERARAAGIAAEIVDHRRFRTREEFERFMSDRLDSHEARLVCLAGFMRVLSPWFTERWRDRLLNIHPSLLPAFPGLDTHRRALAAGVRFSGCTVHFVRAEVDAGPIVVQGVVPVHPDDTPEALAARVLEAEHRCYPLAFDLVASGRARVEGDRVVIEGATAPETIVLNPVPVEPRNRAHAKPKR